jgi:hypothetical protein
LKLVILAPCAAFPTGSAHCFSCARQDHAPFVSRSMVVAEQAQGVFVLCDAGSMGFPIRYVSRGFCKLLGYDEDECVGEFCGMFFGGPAIKADPTALLHIAKKSSLSEAQAARGIDELAHYADKQCEFMLASPEQVGFALVLCRTKKGVILVCEVLMMMLNRPEHGWSYTISFLRDITGMIPVRTVLRAAVQGGYGTLVQALHGGVTTRLASLGIRGSDGGVVGYMQDTALGTRNAMLLAQPSSRMGPSGSPARKHSRASSGTGGAPNGCALAQAETARCLSALV